MAIAFATALAPRLMRGTRGCCVAFVNELRLLDALLLLRPPVEPPLEPRPRPLPRVGVVGITFWPPNVDRMLQDAVDSSVNEFEKREIEFNEFNDELFLYKIIIIMI